MTRHILITILVAALVSFGTYKIVAKDTAVTETKKETAYDRVIRTGTLRCGYGLWPPYMVVKDANTGKLSGALVELMDKVGEKLKLKVEWAEETGWGTWVEGLKTGRFDVFCSSAWQMAETARDVRFGRPLFYNAVYGYARADDKRFDNNLSMINSPDIKISAVDGEISDLVAKNFFPKATKVSLPELSELTLMLVSVTDKKADVVFNEPSFVEGYLAKNPGTLKRITPEPVQVYNSSFAVAINETNLIQMLDTALAELENTGEIDRILTKNGATSSMFLRPRKPY